LPKKRGSTFSARPTPIAGPYSPLTESPVTPDDWQCLDGTLHVDESGAPWIVFCHEWVQVHNGAMYAMQLSHNLMERAGRPLFLFNASEAPWVRRHDWSENADNLAFPFYVTDGPFLFRTRNSSLLMLWSSIGTSGYAMGFARSASGTVLGPWQQVPDPLWAEDGGHGMIFRHFDGRLMLTFHRPNNTPEERAVFLEITDEGDSLRLKPH
jgi:hypothetical protein